MSELIDSNERFRKAVGALPYYYSQRAWERHGSDLEDAIIKLVEDWQRSNMDRYSKPYKPYTSKTEVTP